MKLTDRLLSRQITCLPDEIISPQERTAITDSFAIYRGCAPWQFASGGGLSLAAGICDELSRLTVTEFNVSFNNNRAGTVIGKSLLGFFDRMKIFTEYACALGGVMFKPSFDGSQLSVECCLPCDFRPLGTDAEGRINACAFISRICRGGRYYTKIEEHRPFGDGYKITNRLFVSDGDFDYGKECSLNSVTEWANLSPVTVIKHLHHPLFAYFGIPLGNADFPDSPLGVPVFRRAENLIRQADIQYGRLLWEFEGGELAVDASEDAFRIGKDGKPELPLGKERLFRTNSLDNCNSTGELFQIFAPQLRDSSIINGLNRMIMFIEDTCGIARGTFSDPASVAKTATEVKAMRQRTDATVAAIRRSLRAAIYSLTAACNSIISLYGLAFENASVTVNFGDGVLSDSESRRNAEREDVKCGIISAEEFKKRWYPNSQISLYNRKELI